MIPHKQARPLDLQPVIGVVCVIDIESERVLHVGRNAGQAAKYCDPGTWFAWGDSADEARKLALEQVHARKLQGLS